MTRELAIVEKGARSRRYRSTRPTRRRARSLAGPLAGARAGLGFDPKVENFAAVWDEIEFPRLLRNTAIIAVVSTIGAVGSAICVAYGFSRFRFPVRGPLFLILLATIMLPPQVTLVPTYIMFTRIGWTGTWLPLIVPHFFANAYNVFLLRQYFMTIPRDLDEAAMIDGASPFRILRSVIVPAGDPGHRRRRAVPLLLRLERVPAAAGVRRRQPGAVAAVARDPAVRGAVRDPAPLVQASAIMTIAVPVVVFFLAQRAFMRGVVITGVEK